MVSFHQVSPPKSCMHLSCPPHVPHAQPISFFTIWSTECLVRSTDHEAPHYAVFFTPLLPHPSSAQTSSSATYPQTPSPYPSIHPSKYVCNVCICVCVYTRAHAHTHLLEGIKSEGRMDLYHECHTRLCCSWGSQSYHRGIGCTLGQSTYDLLC